MLLINDMASVCGFIYKSSFISTFQKYSSPQSSPLSSPTHPHSHFDDLHLTFTLHLKPRAL